MANEYVTIVATGLGPFPLDMLRFHQAWPYTQIDSERMRQSFHYEHLADPFIITIQCPRVNTQSHGMKRWASFGWQAIVQE